jgi:hypothetical protein
MVMSIVLDRVERGLAHHLSSTGHAVGPNNLFLSLIP